MAGAPSAPGARAHPSARALQALATLPGVSLHEGGAESLDALLAGQDAAVYLVGILHGSRQDFERAHVGLLQDVIAACQRQGVRRLVLVGAGRGGGRRLGLSANQGPGRSRADGQRAGFGPLFALGDFGRGDSFLNLFADLLAVAPACRWPALARAFSRCGWKTSPMCWPTAWTAPTPTGQRYELAGPEPSPWPSWCAMSASSPATCARCLACRKGWPWRRRR